MLRLGLLLLLLGSCLCKPLVHSSVHTELERLGREQEEAGKDPVTLLITFKSVDLSAASDPQLLLQEARKRIPMLMTVDTKEWVARNDLYQKYRGEYVYKKCKEVHESAKAYLMTLGVTVLEDFLVSNSFLIGNVNQGIVDTLSQRDDVVEVHTNLPFRANVPDPEIGDDDDLDTPLAPSFIRGLWEKITNAVQWNIKKIGADKVWAITDDRSRGAGMVYAVADTGVDYKHPNIAQRYRGFNNATGEYKHDYSWWDGVRKPVRGQTSNSRCSVASPLPCDDSGHGTHVTGIAIGSDGYGVAPDARWIGCRNMDNGVGSTATYLACLQFFAAPTDLRGENPRPDLRPHAVGNSYGCPDDEGCSKNAMTAAFQTLKAMGVFMAVSAGNEGPSCSTVNAPPAVELDALVVGAVNSKDQLASFSSRGPVTVVKGRVYRKPDIVAPGVEVQGPYPNNTFRALSGTSMAGPHVGGAALLVMALCPCYERNMDAITELLTCTAVPLLPLAKSLCGDDTPQSIPNNHYGYGRLDLWAAIRKCRQESVTTGWRW